MSTPFNIHASLNMKPSKFYDGNDLCNVEYIQSCMTYAVPTTGNSTCTLADIWALASSARSNNMPTAFIQLNDSLCMHLFLQSDKVEPKMRRPNGVYTGQMLVQCGDLIGKNKAVVANLMDNCFNAVASVRVTFPPTINTALVGVPVVALMGPHEEGDSASEVVHDHRIAVVSPPFVSALLAGNNYVSVDVWQIVHPMCRSCMGSVVHSFPQIYSSCHDLR